MPVKFQIVSKLWYNLWEERNYTMQNNLNLTHIQIKKYIDALKDFMRQEKLEGFYISSFDKYISEYNPLEDCHRYYFTGFTGSMAEVLVLPEAKVKLYVDGRYWEQADNEVDLNEVEVVKCETHPAQELVDTLSRLKLKNIAVESERTPLSFAQKLEAQWNISYIPTTKLQSLIPFKGYSSQKPVEFLAPEFRGPDTQEKLNRIISDDSEGFFTAALDSVAWITNCRGYHLPNQSSFMGRALLTKNKVYVLVDEGINVSQEAQAQSGLAFIWIKEGQLLKVLQEIQAKEKLTFVKYDKTQINSADFNDLKKTFGESSLINHTGGLTTYHCIKEASEVAEIERSFEKANKAIYNTINYVKEMVGEGKKITELDIYHQTSKEYKKMGAKSQSFNTIAGVGSNSSIIHFSSPSDERVVKNSDFILLDSGGYFDGGFATDTTRTFLADDSIAADKKFIKMYTLVLKGLITLQNSTFPEGVPGSVIDGFTRYALYQEGFDYKHGTGHGVGIHVHEPGVRISTVSQVPMKEGQLVSLEPGCYEPGYGGVRLENIALVIKNEEKPGFLKFKNLVWIGFEEELIDESLLNYQERQWLEQYEAECEKRGNSFR